MSRFILVISFFYFRAVDATDRNRMISFGFYNKLQKSMQCNKCGTHHHPMTVGHRLFNCKKDTLNICTLYMQISFPGNC